MKHLAVLSFICLAVFSCGRSPWRAEESRFDDLVMVQNGALSSLAGFSPGQSVEKLKRYFPKNTTTAEYMRKTLRLGTRTGDLTLFTDNAAVSQVTATFTMPAVDVKFDEFVKKILEEIAKKKPTYTSRDTQEDDKGVIVVTTFTYSDGGGTLTINYGIANETEKFITLSLRR